MKSLALALLLIPGAAFAGPWYELVNGSMSVTGIIGVAASSTTPKNYVLTLDGPHGYIKFPDGTTQNTASAGGTNYFTSTGTYSGTSTFTHPIVGSVTGNAGSVSAGGVDFSTITTALSAKVPYTGATSLVSLGSYGLVTSSDVVAHAYYGDGSHLTGISGSSIVDTTNTFTGSNSFTATGTGGTSISSATVGALTVTGPVTISGSANVPVFLSSASVSSVGSISLNMVPTSSLFGRVDCSFTLVQNTAAGTPYITFNGDTTSGHYAFAGYAYTTGGPGGSATNSTSNIALTYPNGAGIGTPFAGQFSFLTNKTTTLVQVHGQTESSTTVYFWYSYEGVYATANPTYITFTSAAGGTITGQIGCTFTPY